MRFGHGRYRDFTGKSGVSAQDRQLEDVTMLIRPLLLTPLTILALTACDGDNSVRISSTRSSSDEPRGVLKVVEALQCPQTQGALTRIGTASNEGAVCRYSGPRGTEVTLHLVALDGAAPARTLADFETRLSSAMPQAVAGLRASADAAAAAGSPAADGTAQDTASVQAPGVDIQASGDDASVKLPGMRIETKGDSASVRIGGFHIDANDSSGTGQVTVQGEGDSGKSAESVSIQTKDDAAEIRTNAAGAGTRTTWLLTDNRPSADGWRLVGYEARGPEGGPIVVATVRSRDRDQDDAFRDARALLDLNVGR